MAIAFALQDYRSGNSSWKSQVLGNTLQLYEDNRNTSGMYNEVNTLPQMYNQARLTERMARRTPLGTSCKTSTFFFADFSRRSR